MARGCRARAAQLPVSQQDGGGRLEEVRHPYQAGRSRPSGPPSATCAEAACATCPSCFPHPLLVRARCVAHGQLLLGCPGPDSHATCSPRAQPTQQRPHPPHTPPTHIHSGKVDTRACHLSVSMAKGKRAVSKSDVKERCLARPRRLGGGGDGGQQLSGKIGTGRSGHFRRPCAPRVASCNTVTSSLLRDSFGLAPCLQHLHHLPAHPSMVVSSGERPRP